MLINTIKNKIMYMKVLDMTIRNTTRPRSCKNASYNMRYEYSTKTVHIVDHNAFKNT